MAADLFPELIGILMSGITLEINLGYFAIQSGKFGSIFQVIIQFLVTWDWKNSFTFVPGVFINDPLGMFIQNDMQFVISLFGTEI